jgi:hypothetical protein
MLLPGLGTIVGGLVGGFLAGSATSSASQQIMDQFIEDDAQAMSKILEQVLQGLAFDYLLSEVEIGGVLDRLREMGLDRELRNIYGAGDREGYARELLRPIVEGIARQRRKVVLPSVECLAGGYSKVCTALGGDEN